MFEMYSEDQMFPACTASFTFKPAHVHTREFSGYRIPSLHLSSVSSSLFPLLPVCKPVFLWSVFLPCGEAAPGLTGSATDSSHSTLLQLFHAFPPLFHTNTKAHTHMLLYPCLYNVLEEWEHQAILTSSATGGYVYEGLSLYGSHCVNLQVRCM